MDNPARLFLLRHAEVEERYQRVFGGRIDMGLSTFGHEQSRALADYLQRVAFDVIYASPMKRVRQTLAALIERQKSSRYLWKGSAKWILGAGLA